MVNDVATGTNPQPTLTMKSSLQLTSAFLLTALLCGNIVAQQLSFNDFTLVKGNDLQKGAEYRFYHVTSGVDAVIKVTSLSNATLNRIDDSPIATNNLDDAAWRPVVSGVSSTGANELHYVDFDIQFYANGLNKAVGLDSLTMSIFDTDGDSDRADFRDGEDGDAIEFAQVAGFSTLFSTGSNLNVMNYSDGSAIVMAKDSTTNDGITDAAEWLSVWGIEGKHGFSVRFGWQGTDNVMNMDNDRLYGAYFSGDTPSVVIVPEPSSALMALIAAFPLLLRRKR